MRGLVICWMLIGVLGFLIFPWYVTGDGFFSINWILEYSLEDYGSVLPQVFINKKYWLLPLVVPLFFPLSTLKLNQSNPIYSKIFLYSGLFGIFYFILQGFSIGIRGWNFEIFQSIFGDVENQFGVGSGAVLLCSTFIFYITHGLSSRGWLNGDNFIVGSIGSIIILVSTFVFFPIFRMFAVAFKGTEGGYEISNFSTKIFNKGIWGLDCLYSDYACGVFWNTVTMGTLTAFSSTILGVGFALLMARTSFKFKKTIRILSVFFKN